MRRCNDHRVEELGRRRPIGVCSPCNVQKWEGVPINTSSWTVKHGTGQTWADYRYVHIGELSKVY